MKKLACVALAAIMVLLACPISALAKIEGTWGADRPVTGVQSTPDDSDVLLNSDVCRLEYIDKDGNLTTLGPYDQIDDAMEAAFYPYYLAIQYNGGKAFDTSEKWFEAAGRPTIKLNGNVNGKYSRCNWASHVCVEVDEYVNKPAGTKETSVYDAETNKTEVYLKKSTNTDGTLKMQHIVIDYNQFYYSAVSSITGYYDRDIYCAVPPIILIDGAKSEQENYKIVYGKDSDVEKDTYNGGAAFNALAFYSLTLKNVDITINNGKRGTVGSFLWNENHLESDRLDIGINSGSGCGYTPRDCAQTTLIFENTSVYEKTRLVAGEIVPGRAATTRTDIYSGSTLVTYTLSTDRDYGNLGSLFKIKGDGNIDKEDVDTSGRTDIFTIKLKDSSVKSTSAVGAIIHWGSQAHFELENSQWTLAGKAGINQNDCIFQFYQCGPGDIKIDSTSKLIAAREAHTGTYTVVTDKCAHGKEVGKECTSCSGGKAIAQKVCEHGIVEGKMCTKISQGNVGCGKIVSEAYVEKNCGTRSISLIRTLSNCFKEINVQLEKGAELSLRNTVAIETTDGGSMAEGRTQFFGTTTGGGYAGDSHLDGELLRVRDKGAYYTASKNDSDIGLGLATITNPDTNQNYQWLLGAGQPAKQIPKTTSATNLGSTPGWAALYSGRNYAISQIVGYAPIASYWSYHPNELFNYEHMSTFSLCGTPAIEVLRRSSATSSDWKPLKDYTAAFNTNRTQAKGSSASGVEFSVTPDSSVKNEYQYFIKTFTGAGSNTGAKGAYSVDLQGAWDYIYYSQYSSQYKIVLHGDVYVDTYLNPAFGPYNTYGFDSVNGDSTDGTNYRNVRDMVIEGNNYTISCETEKYALFYGLAFYNLTVSDAHLKCKGDDGIMFDWSPRVEKISCSWYENGWNKDVGSYGNFVSKDKINSTDNDALLGSVVDEEGKEHGFKPVTTLNNVTTSPVSGSKAGIFKLKAGHTNTGLGEGKYTIYETSYTVGTGDNRKNYIWPSTELNGINNSGNVKYTVNLNNCDLYSNAQDTMFMILNGAIVDMNISGCNIVYKGGIDKATNGSNQNNHMFMMSAKSVDIDISNSSENVSRIVSSNENNLAETYAGIFFWATNYKSDGSSDNTEQDFKITLGEDVMLVLDATEKNNSAYLDFFQTYEDNIADGSKHARFVTVDNGAKYIATKDALNNGKTILLPSNQAMSTNFGEWLANNQQISGYTAGTTFLYDKSDVHIADLAPSNGDSKEVISDIYFSYKPVCYVQLADGTELGTGGAALSADRSNAFTSLNLAVNYVETLYSDKSGTNDALWQAAGSPTIVLFDDTHHEGPASTIFPKNVFANYDTNKVITIYIKAENSMTPTLSAQNTWINGLFRYNAYYNLKVEGLNIDCNDSMVAFWSGYSNDPYASNNANWSNNYNRLTAGTSGASTTTFKDCTVYANGVQCKENYCTHTDLKGIPHTNEGIVFKVTGNGKDGSRTENYTINIENTDIIAEKGVNNGFLFHHGASGKFVLDGNSTIDHTNDVLGPGSNTTFSISNCGKFEIELKAGASVTGTAGEFSGSTYQMFLFMDSRNNGSGMLPSPKAEGESHYTKGILTIENGVTLTLKDLETSVRNAAFFSCNTSKDEANTLFNIGDGVIMRAHRTCTNVGFRLATGNFEQSGDNASFIVGFNPMTLNGDGSLTVKDSFYGNYVGLHEVQESDIQTDDYVYIKPVGVSFDILPTAALRVSNTSPGIRFTAHFQNSMIERMEGKVARIEMGIIIGNDSIMPKYTVSPLTEKLESPTMKHTVKTGDTARPAANKSVNTGDFTYSSDPYWSDGETTYYHVSLINIGIKNKDNSSVEMTKAGCKATFTGRAYMTITYLNGTQQTFYTNTVNASMATLAQQLDKAGADYLVVDKILAKIAE